MAIGFQLFEPQYDNIDRAWNSFPAFLLSLWTFPFHLAEVLRVLP